MMHELFVLKRKISIYTFVVFYISSYYFGFARASVIFLYFIIEFMFAQNSNFQLTFNGN